MICAVGAEMRDYTTFLEAIRGTHLRCHIATDHVRIPGRLRILNDRRVPIGDIRARADTYITAGRVSLTELRKLYARSRFVVVPLLPSDTDNGVTCILQAMAMGKPVICSRTRGQVDVIEEGVTGLYVPVGDAAALLDPRGGLEAVHAGHDDVEQDDRELVREHRLDGGLAGPDEDEFLVERRQDRLKREQVLGAVIDE